jgi:hypothetical protein
MLFSTSITDNVSILTGGTLSQLKELYTLMGTVSNILYSTSITDGTGKIFSGTMSGFNVASITNYIYAGTVSSGKFTDGTITIADGSLTSSGSSGFIEANIGSFTNLYANDLFVADDMVVNGTTTYVNTSQTSFEDELISLGASNGRSVASVSGENTNTNIICCETDASSSYTANAIVLCMQADGSKEILTVASISDQNSNEITLTSNANANTQFIALIGDESIANGAGIEILAHNSGNSRVKTFHYVHDNSNPCMEIKSEGASLDLRLDNSVDDSYFSVFDDDTHKQLLTSDALFLNTVDGSITNGTDTAAIYLSRNGPKSSSTRKNDQTGDWRIRVDNGSGSQFLSFEQYSGSAWELQWQLT